jgi:WD40 repeat protein
MTEESPSVRRARDGVRVWARSAGSRLRTASPYAILAMLAASAAAPVAGAALGASGEMGAALGQLGGVGSNYLADALATTANRMRDTDPSPERWRDEVAADLRALLEAGDERAAALRDEVTAVLHAVDAVDVALRAADADLREVLVGVFGALGEDVGRLHQLGEDALRVLDAMHQQLAAQSQAQHQQTDLLRQSLVLIALLRQDVAGHRPPAADPTVPADGDGAGPAPYPGMASFDTEQARWFRGREALIADLLVRLGEQVLGGPPLVLVGVSGAGKSSLLRAGVLPAVGLGALGEGSGSWPWLVMTPGTTPLADLVHRTAALARTDPAAALADVRAAPRTFGDLAGRAGGDGRLVILIDQFEELFTQCADPAERDAFVAAIAAAAPALLIIAVRADFYPQCTEMPDLVPMLGAGQVVCGPLGQAELRRAVREPAGIAGLRLETGLEDVLLSDLGMHDGPGGGYQPGALPLLAHALRATWERRDGATLTVAGYRATGGIRRAVADTAERVYLSLGDDGRAALRRAVLALVTVVDDLPVRRRVARDGVDLAVLRPLIEARLVTAGEDSVEISHEALLEGWPRLSYWLVEAREEILLRQRVTQAAAEWAAAGEDPDALYRGARLGVAREWAAGRGDLTESQRRFLAAGADAEAAREQARRRTTGRLRRLAAGLAVALVLVVAGGLVALDQRSDALAAQTAAVAAERLATSRLLATDARTKHFADPLESVRAALGAWEAAPTPEARGALLFAQQTGVIGRLGTEPGAVRAAVSPDGALVAAGFKNGRIQLWDSRTLRTVGPEVQAAAGTLFSLAFSPDGKYLAAGSIARPGVKVWELPGLKQLATLPGVGAATWLPDSSAVLASYFDGDRTGLVGTWDPRTGRLIGSLATPVVPAAADIAVSRDGRYLGITGADGGQLVRRSDGRSLVEFASQTSIRFAADGTLFGTGTSGKVLAWRPAAGAKPVTVNDGVGEEAGLTLAVTGNGTVLVGGRAPGELQQFTLGGPRQPLDGYRGVPMAIALSADDQVVAITSTTQPPQLFRLGVDALPHPQLANYLAIDRTGTRLATVSDDATIRIWDPRTSRAVQTIEVPAGADLLGVGFGPDGALAVASADGRICVFHPDGRLRGTLRIRADLFPAVPRFSPDGSLLTAATNWRDPDQISTTEAQERDDPDLYVWDARTLTERGQIKLPGHISMGHAYTPDGEQLLIASNRVRSGTEDEGRPEGGVLQDGAVWRYRTADLSLIDRRDLIGNAVDEIAISPDGTTVAAAFGRGAELLRVDGLTPAGRIDGHPATVQRVAYSPDGRILATATDTDDDVIRLWDTATNHLITEVRANSNQHGQLAFTPDSSVLAAGAGNWTVTLWRLDPADGVRRLCAMLAPSSAAEGKPMPGPCR